MGVWVPATGTSDPAALKPDNAPNTRAVGFAPIQYRVNIEIFLHLAYLTRHDNFVLMQASPQVRYSAQICYSQRHTPKR